MLAMPTVEPRARDLTDDYVAPTALPFRPGHVAWRVMGEPHVGLTASRALLLQTSHPHVARAVAEHSDYVADPFGRLFRTFDTVTKLAFGEPEQVRRMTRRMASRHAAVSGEMADGSRYDGRDPIVGMWVWATLVDSAALAFERHHGRLSDADRDRLVREAGLFAVACGVTPDLLPDTWADFQAYVDRVVADDLADTPEGQDIARNALTPILPVIGAPVAAFNRATAAVLFPERVARMYGMSPTRSQRAVVGGFARTAGVVLRVLPDSWRHLGVRLICRHDLLVRLDDRTRSRRRRRGAGAGGPTRSRRAG